MADGIGGGQPPLLKPESEGSGLWLAAVLNRRQGGRAVTTAARAKRASWSTPYSRDAVRPRPADSSSPQNEAEKSYTAPALARHPREGSGSGGEVSTMDHQAFLRDDDLDPDEQRRGARESPTALKQDRCGPPQLEGSADRQQYCSTSRRRLAHPPLSLHPSASPSSAASRWSFDNPDHATSGAGETIGDHRQGDDSADGGRSFWRTPPARERIENSRRHRTSPVINA